MSDLEAIKYLEEESDAMESTLGGLPPLTRAKSPLNYRIEAIRISLDALRKKVEREKGCDVCKLSRKSSPLYHWLRAGYKHCPYCGSKLTEDKNNA